MRAFSLPATPTATAPCANVRADAPGQRIRGLLDRKRSDRWSPRSAAASSRRTGPPRHACVSGEADGELALGVGGGDGLERLGRALELVRRLDRHPERAAVEQLRDS